MHDDFAVTCTYSDNTRKTGMNRESAEKCFERHSCDHYPGRCFNCAPLREFDFALFNDALHGMFVCEADGRLLTANRSFQSLTGYSPVDIQELNLADLADGRSRLKFEKLLAETMSAGAPESFVELAIKCKDGRLLWIAVEGVSIERDGQPRRVVGIFHDLTDRQTLLDELKSRQAGHHRILIDSYENAAFLIDLDGNILMANKHGARRLGYESNEIVGRNFSDLLPPEVVKRRKDIALEAILAGKVVRFEDEDGDAIYEHKYYPIRDDSGKVNQLAIFSVDITEQKASDNERERLQAQLQQAQKMEAIGTLAGGIAHDFNNLMMAIQGNVSLVLMNMPPTHAHFEPLKNIERGIRKGADLTAKLLGYARKGNYEMKPMDPNLLVNEMSEAFGRMRKGITIETELAQDLCSIMADKGQLEQVLLNLFVNASDAMPKGGKLTIKTCSVSHESIPTDQYSPNPGLYVLLSIIDSGTGMTPEVQERIFDPFFTTKKMGRGTGLGLASAYGIVKSHNGYIEVESEVGKGSTFMIYLPASKRRPQPIKEEPSPVTNGSGTVLLVDDESNVLKVTSKMLSRSGYKVIEATSGLEAIERYSGDQDAIDLVILDMVMPEMGGGEVYDRIKAINPGVKVLLASGYSLEGQAREIMKRGCNSFIQKPFTLSHLVTRVQAVIAAQ